MTMLKIDYLKKHFSDKMTREDLSISLKRNLFGFKWMAYFEWNVLYTGGLQIGNLLGRLRILYQQETTKDFYLNTGYIENKF